MNFRWYLYWIQDFVLNKGLVRKAYKDIEKYYYAENKNTDNKIENLLKHAQETTEFYKENTTYDINNYPVVNKRVLIENYDKILSTKYKDQKLHTMSTSGSTGTPFTVVQDKIKRSRVIAAVIFFGKQCGYTFGERQMFLRVWVKSIKKSGLKKFLQNMIPVDISKLDDEKLTEIENILIQDKNVSNILSYASTLDKLSRYLKSKKHTSVDFSIKSIISGSEVLQDETRENLKKVFDCNVVSRYANEENGILGQECIESNNEFHLNYADYYFEFLKLDEDIPAEQGEMARIVITDLYNYAFPMIRYDTGDLAIVGESSCENKGIVIKEIFGRRVDLITNPNGEALSPHMITNNMWGVEKIKQFKFSQLTQNEYKILLNVEDGFDGEKVLLEKFENLLGKDAVISFEYTDEIPVLNSGKRKYIENLYNKGK